MVRLWCTILVLFMTMQGCFGDDLELYFQQICDSAEKCAEDGIGKKLCRINFLPSTEEELHSYCPSIARIMWCAAKSIFLWTPPSDSIENFVDSGFNLGKVICEICTYGSQLRQNYLAGISCFKDLLFDGRTYNNCIVNGHQTIHSLNLSIEGASEEERELDRMCMSTFYGLACLVVETENFCGKVASNMINEIFQKVKLLTLINCSGDNMQDLTIKFLDSKSLDRERAKIFISFFES
ncbi:hypothetical protein AVEN_75591-1 [Araneus ventricosus]|uniref:DUF19 domain-containing protein n=1 Tax=Araneus ventricosus TaxID=182803 RepID=A0A4Y2CLN0_ARAVE|nr:hypothetical protein AVEN_75591-1 [Araneus ventricosus]